MARILILQEEPCWESALSRSLGPFHEVQFVSSAKEALVRLKQQAYDLVIARVHLRHSDPFEFLKRIQAEHLTGIPVLCFCGTRTRTSNIASSAVRSAVQALGAAGFLSIEDFARSESCDFDALRNAIESIMTEYQSRESSQG
jgi:CheY-like chemotaxis protein